MKIRITYPDIGLIGEEKYEKYRTIASEFKLRFSGDEFIERMSNGFPTDKPTDYMLYFEYEGNRVEVNFRGNRVNISVVVRPGVCVATQYIFDSGNMESISDYIMEKLCNGGALKSIGGGISDYLSVEMDFCPVFKKTDRILWSNLHENEYRLYCEDSYTIKARMNDEGHWLYKLSSGAAFAGFMDLSDEHKDINNVLTQLLGKVWGNKVNEMMREK